MRCVVCGKQLRAAPVLEPNNRPYWQRKYGDAVVCHACFLAPGEIEDFLTRRTIASIIWHARSVSRAEAITALMSLRGTGIPPNPHRGRRSHAKS